MRQPDQSRSAYECDISKCRVLKAIENPIALRVPMAMSLCISVGLSDYRCLLCMALVSGALEPVELEERCVHVVCVWVASSTMPTMVTSSVESPRFCVSQAH
ncbi:hypothetical protein Taro_050076 [Colocasia esculenta]|uniref:Uncharacterized protein n=1 Tax=Colocasia esculenta TaxID=4460 RepID=A0A843XCH2_COLES|nr:hypothetical protein [Colocasia esculenta]